MTAPGPSTSARPMTLGEWGLLIGLSLLWGGSFFFNGVAVAELPVLTVIASRVGLAALILLAVLRLAGHALPAARSVWVPFFVMGCLNNIVPFGLIVWAQAHIPSGVASILNASTPLFGVLVAHAATRTEKLTPARLAGVLVGLAGVAIMVGTEAFDAMGPGLLPPLACLVAALSYAVAGVYARRFAAAGLHPLQTATGQIVASSVLLVPAALVLDRPWLLAAPSPEALGALVGLAAFSTALAYLLYFRILGSAGATNLLLVTLLVPVSAILLGVTLLGEALLQRHVAGMALIALGLAAIDGRVVRAFRPRGV